MTAARTIDRGVLASVRAGIAAGGLAGFLAGLADGVRAVFAVPIEVGSGSALLCIAASVLQHAFLAACVLALLGLVGHPFLRAHEFPRRYRALLGLGLGVALFTHLYWHTREWVFPGYSALSWQRLAAAGVFLGVALVLGGRLAALITRIPAPAQRGFSAALAICVVAGGIFLATKHEPLGAKGKLNERNRDLPNVLLVVCDALRQDVLGCYGNTRVKTPNFDRLAREGVVFENAFVQAPFTWTSFGSLLTGKYPRRHGLMKMKKGVAMLEQATLPWHLKHAVREDGRALEPDDYITASFHTGTLKESSKLLRGFDFVFEETAGHDLFEVEDVWSRVRSELLLWTLQNRVRKRLDSGLVASEARKFLGELDGRRFMAMVHLYPTHTPYDPPREYAQMYCDPKYTGPIKAFYASGRQTIERGEYTPTPADVQQIRDLYYGGVSQADALVGELLALLEREGVRDDTLVIVTADHGESLGEDGLWEHNHLVRRELCVPLLMSYPRGLPKGVRVAQLVDEIDVLPTVCDLADLKLPAATDERSKIDGASLLPLVRGEPVEWKRFSFAESGSGIAIHDLEHLLVVPRSVLDAPDLAEAQRRFEVQLRDPAHKPRLIDVRAAGENEAHVLAQRPQVAEELLAAVHAWSRSMPIPAHEVITSARDDETDEVLKQTGYGGGIDGDEDEPPPKPPTPQQRAPQEQDAR